MFAKPMEKPNVACLWHCEIVYHHENHLSLSFKNNMAFFYLSVNFLVCLYRRVVRRLQNYISSLAGKTCHVGALFDYCSRYFLKLSVTAELKRAQLELY